MKTEKPINKVTVTNLDIALRMCNIQLNKSIIDKILDLVELIEERGDAVTIADVCRLQAAWGKLDQIK